MIKFKKNHTEIQALMDSGDKVIAIILANAAILGLRIYLTDIKT